MAISVVAYFYHFLSEELGTLSGQRLQFDICDLLLRYLEARGGVDYLTILGRPSWPKSR